MGCCGSSPKEDPRRTINPDRPRACTDIPALSIFILFWCGMVLICAFALVNGDMWRLLYGSDSFGNTCGRQNAPLNLTHSGMDMRNKSYLFALDILKPFDSIWICVESCPTYKLNGAVDLQIYAQQYGAQYCLYDVPVNQYTDEVMQLQTELGPCPVTPVFNSTPILHRCIPTSTIDLGMVAVERIFGFLNDVNFLEQILADLVRTYRTVLMLCLFAFVIALVIVFLIRFVASIVVYLIFALVLIGGAAITAGLWYGFYHLKTSLDQTQLTTNGTQLLALRTKNEHAILIYAIVSSVITAVLFAIVCCLWSSSKIVVDLFREAGRALQSMPCLLMQPFYTFIALMILFVYWGVVVLMLATASQVGFEKKVSQSLHHIQMMVVSYEQPNFVKYMWWYHVIGLIWTAEFILACQQMVVAGSVAVWYFSKRNRSVSYPICISMKRLIMYHLGSVALGALIITLVKIPRLILMYLQKKLKESQVPCAEFCTKCCICCLYCIEKCLRYIHHNAYTIIAIEGRSFCPAAKQALEILTANAVHVSAINLVGDFVLFLAKCGVTAVAGFLAALFFKNDPELHFYAAPLLLVCLFAFFIAHCFFSVYEMAIDTLFLCFAEDKDFSDSAGGDVYADRKFQEFMVRGKRAERELYGRRDAQPPPTAV